MSNRHGRSLAFAVLLVTLAACSTDGPADSARPTRAPSPSSTAAIQDILKLEKFAPLQPGTYGIDPDLDPATPLRVVFDIPSEGWLQWIGAFKEGDKQLIGLSITTVLNLARHGCTDHSWADPPVGPSVDDLAAGLAALAPFRVTSPPKDVTMYGYRGKHLELTVPPEMPHNEDGFVECVDNNLNSWVGAVMADQKNDAFHGYPIPGHREEFWILDVEGTRLMIAAERSPGSSPRDLAELQDILDSIRIKV